MSKVRTLTTKLLLGMGANAFGQLVTICTQVVQIPLFLHTYGVEPTGEWLLLSAVPTYIALSDIGLSNVAANEMSIAMSSGQQRRALEITQSLCRFIGLVCAGLVALITILGFTMDWTAMLNLKHLSATQSSQVLVLLCLSAVVYLSSGIFYGTYRACNRGARVFVLMNLARLGDLIGMLCSVGLGMGFVGVATTLLLIRLLTFVLIWLDSTRSCQELPLGFAEGRWREMKQMLRPAIAFMAFPLGNALYFQGTTFVVNATLGAAAVVAYNTCRIFSRSAPLALSIVRQTLWMEYPHLHARGETDKIRVLQRIAGGIAWAALLLTLLVTLPLGPWIIRRWTLGRVELGSGVIGLFVVVAGLNCFWNTASTLMIALNRHEGLAKRYVTWVIIALVACYAGAAKGGIAVIGLALLIAEIPLCWHVVVHVCRLAGDSISAYLLDVVTARSFIASLPRLIQLLQRRRTVEIHT